jgi:c(7)-type cytochrome triheme protein
MKRLARSIVRGSVLVGALVVAGSAWGGGKLPKLPADHVFAQGDGSPGPVTFSHASHVDAAAPACIACHPRSFRILEKGRTASAEPIRHLQMEAGAGCGACHGKSAFGFESCDTCHRS